MFYDTGSVLNRSIKRVAANQVSAFADAGFICRMVDQISLFSVQGVGPKRMSQALAVRTTFHWLSCFSRDTYIPSFITSSGW